MKEPLESCMDFSPLFNHDNAIYFEKTKFVRMKNVRAVEFVALRNKNDMCFVEAKRTAPNVKNPGDANKVNEFFHELVEKIQQSLDLYVSNVLDINRDTFNEFPLSMTKVNFSDCKLRYLVVIAKSEDEWCGDVHEELMKKLIPLRKIWGIEITVLTGEQAINMGYASRFICKLDKTIWTGYPDCPRDDGYCMAKHYEEQQ